jgi:hypothetical protein
MSYHAKALEVLDDSVEFIRLHPDNFVPGGFNASVVAGRLATEALLIGASHAVIERYETWLIVSADIDWLSAGCRCPVEPREVFFHIAAFPEAGTNAFRAGVLLTALAPRVIAASPDERFVVKGDVRRQ